MFRKGVAEHFFIREYKMLLLSSCCGYKYAFGMSTFESTDVEAFPEQTDSREVVARKVLRLQLWDPHHHLVGWCRCGGGSRGERREKAASDSPLLSDSPLYPTHHTR